jgi:hypothetical protein
MGLFADAHLFLYAMDDAIALDRVTHIYTWIRKNFESEYDDGLPLLVASRHSIEVRGGRLVRNSIARIDVECSDERAHRKERIALMAAFFEPLLIEGGIDVIQYNVPAFPRVLARSQLFLDGWMPYVRNRAMQVFETVEGHATPAACISEEMPKPERLKLTYAEASAMAHRQ